MIKIEKAKIKDMPSLLELWKEMIDYHKKIIGYLMAFIDELPPVYKNNKYAYISDGVVTKKYRNKGIMKRMLNQTTRFFKKKRLKEIGLKVYTKNIIGIKAWSKIGFKEDAKLMFIDIK